MVKMQQISMDGGEVRLVATENLARAMAVLQREIGPGRDVGTKSLKRKKSGGDLANDPQATRGPSKKRASKQEHGGRVSDQSDLLECRVCLETPRAGPVFSCENGHLICQECHARMSASSRPCFVCGCRRVDVRCLLADRMLESLAKAGRVVECRGRMHGCGVRAEIKEIQQHEEKCRFRYVSCPGRFSGTCSWSGPLFSLSEHVTRARCIQVMRPVEQDQGESTCLIHDYLQDGRTVFDRSVGMSWKPCLLRGRDGGSAFVVIARDSKGDWTLSARSFCGKAWAENVRVRMAVAMDSGNNDQIGAEYSTVCRLLPFDSSAEAASASGETLSLRDPQVKRLNSRSENNVLFRLRAQLVQLDKNEDENNNNNTEAVVIKQEI